MAMRKKLNEQVIVITGASSGIGLATAKMAAARGAKLVLTSRNGDELKNIVDEINASGGQALAVTADVADPQGLEAVAKSAIDRFGGFDTWFNNAGTSIYGKLTEVPLADKRRLFDVNFWGVVHGCRAAVPFLREHGGTLINMGSVVSERAVPLQGIYAASKHAVKAYTDALRMELEADSAPIAVSLIMPGSIDTPFTEHAQNYLETNPSLPPPVYSPEVVAHAVLECAENPRRDVFVGSGAKVMATLDHLIPRTTDWIMEKFMFRKQKQDQAKTQNSGLYAVPSHEGQTRGNYQGHVARTSLYTETTLHPLRSLMIAGVTIGAASLALNQAGRYAVRRGMFGIAGALARRFAPGGVLGRV